MSVPSWFEELLAWADLSTEQVSSLFAHYTLLERWNKRINLTSVEAGEEMVIRHYCESLFFGAHMPEPVHSVADIGSGAGFPGIPIAILKSNCQVALVESNQRKAVFLREATRHLGNVKILSKRAESIEAKFDFLVSRAVSPHEVVQLVPRLANRIGLMLTEGDYTGILAERHIAWSEPIGLPWGDRRICVFGSCSTWNVRGTSWQKS